MKNRGPCAGGHRPDQIDRHLGKCRMDSSSPRADVNLLDDFVTSQVDGGDVLGYRFVGKKHQVRCLYLSGNENKGTFIVLSTTWTSLLPPRPLLPSTLLRGSVSSPTYRSASTSLRYRPASLHYRKRVFVRNVPSDGQDRFLRLSLAFTAVTYCSKSPSSSIGQTR